MSGRAHADAPVLVADPIGPPAVHDRPARGLVEAVLSAKAAARARGDIARGDAAKAARDAAREAAQAARPTWPDGWVESGFPARAEDLGLLLYAEQLAQLYTGELERTAAFDAFRRRWREHAPRPGRARAALLTGDYGRGKSVSALWACFDVHRAGGSWGWMDVARLAEVYARGHWHLVDRLRRADLVVWDEVGDAENIKGHVWATFKSLVNERYSGRRCQILNAIHDEAEITKLLGGEIIDRIPPELRLDAPGGSLRHGGEH